uniref:Uncharacterized protein n=1 Tax=Timema douglasi TaxID=61478 RepID=A0A7R8Z3I9_TIMDO|nr:unnamed protein product [Timema douglasi]
MERGDEKISENITFGNKPPSAPGQASNLNLSVIEIPVYCEFYALNCVANGACLFGRLDLEISRPNERSQNLRPSGVHRMVESDLAPKQSSCGLYTVAEPDSLGSRGSRRDWYL